jgi:hypothetical protein
MNLKQEGKNIVSYNPVQAEADLSSFYFVPGVSNMQDAAAPLVSLSL